MADGKWGGLWGALGGDETINGDVVKGAPEQLAIGLDMLGQGFDPNNVAAGIGTALGKSQLAAKAETAGQKQSQNMFQQLLKAMTPGDKPGPTKLTTSIGKDGTGIDYSLTGLAGMDQPVKAPNVSSGVETPKILTADDFMKDFGGGNI